MKDSTIGNFNIDYIELYAPMAKALSYWHVMALGFTNDAYWEGDNEELGLCSYVLKSNDITLVLTSYYPTSNSNSNNDVSKYINQNYCGVKKIALRVDDVSAVFNSCILNGAIPLKFPERKEDSFGFIEEASIKLYDQNEIVFINRNSYTGCFKPRFNKISSDIINNGSFFEKIDHIASELKINEGQYWSNYLSMVLNAGVVQSFGQSEHNTTGMTLKVNQSLDKNLTLVIAEPELSENRTKIQTNINMFGSGIHHLAFTTNDLFKTMDELNRRGVEFVKVKGSYYELLRQNEDFKNIDIDALEKNGILIDKENDSYLLQKFIKPISERPFFFYEIVQRVNGYNGFAIKNINVLKKAEEMEIIKSSDERK